jgi:hypothetical protein
MILFSNFLFLIQNAALAPKKVEISKVVAIFKRENFLNIGKKRNILAINSAEKKDHCLRK